MDACACVRVDMGVHMDLYVRMSVGVNMFIYLKSLTRGACPHITWGISAQTYAVMPQAATRCKSSSCSKMRHVVATFIYAIITLYLNTVLNRLNMSTCALDY